MSTVFTERVVAIAGRPNVGKSAIFNRIVGRRLSIVHEEVGVTRDRVSAEADVRGRKFELIDTGGLGFLDGETTRDGIEKGIRDQVAAALEDAKVIILVVDITAGMQPLDREVARVFRESGRPVFVAVNKCDNDTVQASADEFAELAFPLFPVSALHNRGFDALLQHVVEALPDEEPVTRENPLRVAVVGKPNAGKSSYLNRILDEERLIVSDIAGTTRDSVELPFTIGEGEEARHYLLVDTAGLRHIRRASTAVEYYSVLRSQKAIERADVVVMMLDAEQGPTRQDKRIASMILKAQKGCVILVNKWDLARGKVKQKEYLDAIREAVPFLNFVPVLFVSAKDGSNIAKSIEVIDEVAASITQTLTTGVLNRVLQDAYAKVQPPAVRNRRFKFYYATQIGVRPIRIAMFVNDTKFLTQPYLAYLINQLRAAYDLDGAPVDLILKAKPAQREPASTSAPRKPAAKRPARAAKPEEKPRRRRRGEGRNPKPTR